MNDFTEQLSSCPAKTKELWGTVWGAISSLSTTLISVDNQNPESGRIGVGTSFAAVRTVGSCGGSNMGTVKSRAITSDDTNSNDEGNANGPSNFQQHHQIKGYCGNGGGYLQKNDLRYDIGNNSHYHPLRQPSVRSRSCQPMPPSEELDRKFTKVLVSIFYI